MASYVKAAATGANPHVTFTNFIRQGRIEGKSYTIIIFELEQLVKCGYFKPLHVVFDKEPDRPRVIFHMTNKVKRDLFWDCN